MFFNYLAYARIGLRIIKEFSRLFVLASVISLFVIIGMATQPWLADLSIMASIFVGLTIHLGLTFFLAVFVFAPFWGWRQLRCIEKRHGREIRQVVFEKLSDFDVRPSVIDNARELVQETRSLN